MNRPVVPPEHFEGLPGNSLNPPRPLWQSLLRGAYCRCPACGTGRLFPRFLKVAPFCEACGEALYHARTDDAPPYFVMLIAGHILVPVALFLEEGFAPPVWLTTSVLVVLALVLCLSLLQPVKGVLVGLQWALWMHGFDPHEEEDPTRVPAGIALKAPRIVTEC